MYRHIAIKFAILVELQVSYVEASGIKFNAYLHLVDLFQIVKNPPEFLHAFDWWNWYMHDCFSVRYSHLELAQW